MAILRGKRNPKTSQRVLRPQITDYLYLSGINRSKKTMNPEEAKQTDGNPNQTLTKNQKKKEKQRLKKMEKKQAELDPWTAIIGSSSQAEVQPSTEIIGSSSQPQAEESNVVIDRDELAIEKLCDHGVSTNLVKILKDDAQIQTINQLVIKDNTIQRFSQDNITTIHTAITIIKSKVKSQAKAFAEELDDLCVKSCGRGTDRKVVEVFAKATACTLEYKRFGDILNEVKNMGSPETVKLIGNLIMQIHVDKRQGYSIHARLKKDKERATKELQLEATRQKLEATRQKEILAEAARDKAAQEIAAAEVKEYILNGDDEILVETLNLEEEEILEKLKLAEIHTLNALSKKKRKDLYDPIGLTETEVSQLWKATRNLQASITRDAKDFCDGWLNYCLSREEKGWSSSIRKFYSDSEFCGSPATFSEYMSYMSACEKKKIAAYRAYSVIIAEDKKKEEEKRINAEQAYKARCDKNAEAQRLEIDRLNALVAESGDAVKKAHAAAATAKSELKESENKRKEAENKRKEAEGLLMAKLEESEKKRKEAEGLLMAKLEESEKKRKEAEEAALVYSFVVDTNNLARGETEGRRIDAKAMENRMQNGFCKVLECLHGLENFNESYFQDMHFFLRERSSSTSAVGSSTSAVSSSSTSAPEEGKGKPKNHDT